MIGAARRAWFPCDVFGITQFSQAAIFHYSDGCVTVQRVLYNTSKRIPTLCRSSSVLCDPLSFGVDILVRDLSSEPTNPHTRRVFLANKHCRRRYLAAKRATAT